MTGGYGKQQKEENRTTPKDLYKDQHDVMIILPHVQNVHGFTYAWTPKIKCHKFPPTQFKISQQVVI